MCQVAAYVGGNLKIPLCTCSIWVYFIVGMRGRGEGSFRTADINWGWVERRQEEKLSWQPLFSTERYKAFCFLELLPLHWNCPSQRESVGRRASRCWCQSPRDAPGCTQLPSTAGMLPVTASAGGSTLEFWLQQSRWRTCRVDPAHILLPAQGAGRLTGSCGWGAAHGRLWVVLSLGGGKKGMCNRGFAVEACCAYWSNFPFLSHAWKMSYFHYIGLFWYIFWWHSLHNSSFFNSHCGFKSVDVIDL